MLDIRASISAGCEWLHRHAPYLLPDTLVFAEIGLRAAQMSVPQRLRPPTAGRVAEALIPLTPAYRTIAAAAGPVYFGYRGDPPLVAGHLEQAIGETLGQAERSTSEPRDGAMINRALAEAVRGRLSLNSLRWMRQRGHGGFVLTHQLLAWLFCVWNQSRIDARRMARRLGGAVFRDAARIGGYYDLLAQGTAFLTLGGWPQKGLRPLVGRILASQDALDGGWHYFEASGLDASEALSRVFCGRSALIPWPIPYEEGQLGLLARTIHLVHRGHATGLSICALGVFWEGDAKSR